ncbi:unnamed protein product, partial [marine sediment metagenome]
YILGGAFNGKAYYKRATGGFYIRWSNAELGTDGPVEVPVPPDKVSTIGAPI